MKCPKYIVRALERRAMLAMKFQEVDRTICEYLERNGIEVDLCDIQFGSEAFCNPYESSGRVLDAIFDKKKGERR